MRFHKAQHIAWITTLHRGKSANMAAFSKVQSLFPDPPPQAEKEGHKVCFYVARGKLAIEIIS